MCVCACVYVCVHVCVHVSVRACVCVCVCDAHLSQADRSIITTLETNKMGGMPKWMLKMILSSTAPSLMRGLEQRYIENIRKADKVLDLTPEGRSARAPGALVW